MKKLLVGAVILVMVVVMLFTLTACDKYKLDAVGTKEYANEEAVGNGTLAVKQGKYLYFVNNVADDANLTKETNEWKANGTNGAIMKSTINEDGSLTCLGIVVPKMFYTDASDAGIYVYGEWIYYVARSQKTDNKGALLSSLEFMRTKIDGTKTQSIAIVEDLAAGYIFTKTGLIYSYDSNIHYVDYSGKKIKDTVVVEKYTDIQFSEEDLCVFYTQANENEYVLGNHLGVVTSTGENKTIIKEDAYYVGDGDYRTSLSTLFTLDIIAYNAKDNSIYYTKTCKDTDAQATTNGYVLPDDYAFNKANEKTYALSALSSIYSLGAANGIVDVSAATVVAYAPMEDAITVKKSDEVTFSSTITILYEEDGFTYYLLSSKLYRANLFASNTINKNAYEEKISNVSFSTKFGKPSYLDGYLYYESSDDATYLSRIKMSDYDSTTQALIKGYIVSGYKDYTYPEDADYTINKDDEAIKGKVPAYITDADLETYITNHKTTNE